MKELMALGLGQFFIGQLEDFENEISRLGRVTSIQRGSCLVDTGLEVVQTQGVGEATVGDFCLLQYLDQDTIRVERILDRKSLLRRHASSSEKTQNICSNIDTIFLVTSLNGDLKLNRIERYLLAIHESGADPVIILTKKDLCDDLDGVLGSLKEITRDIPVCPVDSLSGEGFAAIDAYLSPGATVGLVGSSGVGKTTIINRLRGVDIASGTQGISYGDRGRHTTTSRDLIQLAGGALVIDTPGMREFAPVIGDALEDVFDDIEALGKSCRYRDCAHINESGCSVVQAVTEGKISQRRFDNYHKLLRHQQRIENPRFREEERKYWKSITKEYRRMKKGQDKP